MTRVTTPPPRTSWVGGLVAGGVAAIVLAFPIFWAGFLAMIAWAGCVVHCESSQPDVPNVILWVGVVLVMVVDVFLWGFAGYMRMARPWLIAALSLLLVPLGMFAFSGMLGL